MRDGGPPENKPREGTGKCRQFNGFDLVQTGSGPGERWFKSTRPDQSFCNQQLMERELLMQNQEVSGSNYNALPLQKARNLVPAGNLPNEIDLCLSIWSSIRMQHVMKPGRRFIKNIRMLP